MYLIQNGHKIEIHQQENNFSSNRAAYSSPADVHAHSHATGKEGKAHVKEEKEHESHIRIQFLSRCTLCLVGNREGGGRAGLKGHQLLIFSVRYESQLSALPVIDRTWGS